MKSTLFTLAFVSLFALAGNAQDASKKKTTKSEKAATTSPTVTNTGSVVSVETIAPDGTIITTTSQVPNGNQNPGVNNGDPAISTAPSGGPKTRSAINQKGTPGSSKAPSTTTSPADNSAKPK